MSASPFLDDDELVRLTGYKIGKKQAEFLSNNGIRFFRNRLGRVVVPRSAVDGGTRETEDAPFTLRKVM